MKVADSRIVTIFKLFIAFHLLSEPNDDVKVWLKKHKDTLKEQSLKDDFELLKTLNTRKKV